MLETQALIFCDKFQVLNERLETHAFILQQIPRVKRKVGNTSIDILRYLLGTKHLM